MFYNNKPNLKGKACDVRQHEIRITVHNCIPLFPNYRLGPTDGSVSDSLGIDNIPIAEFRFDQDTALYKQFEFTNLSWYEPTEFWWDYGDGSPIYYTTVWDTSIVHTFPKNGIYKVCLRAKNSNGENTICKDLQIGSTSTILNISNKNLEVYPNPISNILIINLNDYLPERMYYQMYDITGKIIQSDRIFAGSNIIEAEKIHSGIYFISIYEKGQLIKTEKFIKL